MPVNKHPARVSLEAGWFMSPSLPKRHYFLQYDGVSLCGMAKPLDRHFWEGNTPELDDVPANCGRCRNYLRKHIRHGNRLLGR